jgi:hypothetical protein
MINEENHGMYYDEEDHCMIMQDEDYLVHKQRICLQQELAICISKKNMYTSMINMISQCRDTNMHDRIVLSDLQRMLQYYEMKIEVANIRLNTVPTSQTWGGCMS